LKRAALDKEYFSLSGNSQERAAQSSLRPSAIRESPTAQRISPRDVPIGAFLSAMTRRDIATSRNFMGLARQIPKKNREKRSMRMK